MNDELYSLSFTQEQLEMLFQAISLGWEWTDGNVFPDDYESWTPEVGVEYNTTMQSWSDLSSLVSQKLLDAKCTQHLEKHE